MTCRVLGTNLWELIDQYWEIHSGHASQLKDSVFVGHWVSANGLVRYISGRSHRWNRVPAGVTCPSLHDVPPKKRLLTSSVHSRMLYGLLKALWTRPQIASSLRMHTWVACKFCPYKNDDHDGYQWFCNFSQTQLPYLRRRTLTSTAKKQSDLFQPQPVEDTMK